MATIQMVNRLQERQGLRLAEALESSEEVAGVAWWAAESEEAPQLLVGFADYRSQGPLACITRVESALARLPLGDALGLMDTRSVASDDARLKALATHPWTSTVPLDNPDLTYRLVNVWTREGGPAQALVYFLKAGEGSVPLPRALSKTA